MTPDPDRILFATDVVAIGQFRCGADHPLFRDSGPIRQPCFVFPRTTVVIAHEGRPPFIADPSLLTLYNGGHRYERRSISPEGDRCDWFAVTPATLRDAIRSFDASAADEPVAILRHQHATSSTHLYWRQRQLFRSVRDDDRTGARAIEPIDVEERVCALLQDVLRSAYRTGPAPAAPAHTHARRALADAARRFIARHFADTFTLSALAAGLGGSPFHLCRAFREVTGRTLHGYRDDLRLRASLERIEAGLKLTTVALDLGYSSHSHFTERFRRAFGRPPSRALAAALLERGRASNFAPEQESDSRRGRAGAPSCS